jgi:hypothetical protein
MKLLPVLLISFLLSYSNANAQLSPPGLGDTHDAFWSAIGVQQKISEKTTSMTYVGEGRISGPNDNDMMKEQSILVLNEEMYHAINPSWKYSYALSYRRQDLYGDNTAYEVKHPEIQQEFRVYGRLSNSRTLGRMKWKNTLRQEVRKFYTPDFDNPEDVMQLRTRLKTQLTLQLGSTNENHITGSAEALFSISDETNAGWGSFGYKESRFCLYYSYAPKSLPVTFDVGYMNDLMGYGHDVADASYLAFDIILENPF